MSFPLHLTTFSTISLTAAASSLYFFTNTIFYHTHFRSSFIWLFYYAFISLHVTLFVYRDFIKNLTFLNEGYFVKYIAPRVLFFASCWLHFVPDTSRTGLLFVIALWVDVLAISQIIRPVTEPKLLIQLMMPIVTRAMGLYNFSGTYWMITLFCFLVMYAHNFYGGKQGESPQVVEGDNKKDE